MSPNAEPEAIQGAYRALMRKYHPDANGGAYSDVRAKQISEANATLSNPGLRAAYDAQLRAADRPAHPETTGQGATPTAPADGFAPTKPFRTTGRKMTDLTWGLTALATIGFAAAGFATGRLLWSTPARLSEAVSEPDSKPPAADQGRDAPAGRAGTRRVASTTRTVASVVSDDIVPRWRPDCSAGAGPVAVDVQVNVAPDGSLLSTRVAGGVGDPLPLAAAEESARRAVRQAAPFALPRASYDQWRVFIVRFDTKDVCG